MKKAGNGGHTTHYTLHTLWAVAVGGSKRHEHTNTNGINQSISPPPDPWPGEGEVERG